MDEKELAHRVLYRARYGEPLKIVEPVAERWLAMLESNWDAYAVEVARHKSNDWTKHGWTEEKLQGDVRLAAFKRAQVEDAKLDAIWGALEDLRPVWPLRWHEPYFLRPLDRLIDTFFLPGGTVWEHTLAYRIPNDFRPLDLQEFEFEPGSDRLFFEHWIGYSIHIASLTYPISPVMNGQVSYQYYQMYRHKLKQVAIYRALAAIRAAMLDGREITAEMENAIDSACDMDGGNFDESGAFIWYPDLPPYKQAAWDEVVARWEMGIHPCHEAAQHGMNV